MTMTTTMIVVVASLLVVVDVAVEGEGVDLDGRLMTPGSKTHLKKIITVTTDVADGVKPAVLATTMTTETVDGLGGAVLATTTLAITMTMTTTMTLTTTMILDVVDGVVEAVMEDRHVVVPMGLDRLVQ